MYILAIWKFVFDIIRIFFFTIDKIVFNFIPTIYDLLLSIARTSILSQADILEMADRIYKLLAVFMVFKVTFSLIMYVVNPDDFSDKSKGLGKLGTNIVISLTLLILTPYIFNYAYRLQTIVLEDNALMSLVFGDEDGNSSRSVLNSAGEEMAFTTLIPFFMPDVSNEKLLDCVDLTSNIDTCADQMINITSTTSIAGNEEKKYETDINNYREGIRHKSLGLTLRSDMVNITETGTDNYIINYKPIISTAVGVIVILLLITFCIDVALRSVKLAFLQLIAPIPIISYVDPKSGKDGMFKKWYEMCFKTYLSLFIRLLAIYFAIYIIGKTDKLVDIVDGSKVTNFYIHIFIIIGALMFAKQFPEILKGLGIKLDGDGKFFLNPLKKVEEQALGGKRITGAVGGMAAGAVGGHGFFGRIGSAVTGAGRGFATNKGYKGGLERQADVNRKLREARINGAGFFGSRAAVLSSRYGLDDADLEKEATNLREDKRAIELASREVEAKNKPLEAHKKSIQAKIKPTEDLIKKKQAVRQSIKSMEDYAVKQIEGNKAGEVSDEYRRRKAVHQYLQNNVGQELDTARTIGGTSYSAGTIISPEMVAAADNDTAYYLNKAGKQQVFDALKSGTYHDAGAIGMFASMYDLYEKSVEDYNRDEQDASEQLNVEGNYSDIHSQGDDVDKSVSRKQTEIMGDRSEIERIDREIQNNQVEQKVKISGNKEVISLDEAQAELKTRESNLKDKQDQRKLNRETAKNRRIGGS